MFWTLLDWVKTGNSDIWLCRLGSTFEAYEGSAGLPSHFHMKAGWWRCMSWPAWWGMQYPMFFFFYEHVAEPKIGTLQKRNNQFIPGISRVFSCSVSVRFKSEYHSPSDFLSVFCRKCSLFSKIPIKGSVGCLKIDSIPFHGKKNIVFPTKLQIIGIHALFLENNISHCRLYPIVFHYTYLINYIPHIPMIYSWLCWFYIGL